MEEKSVLIQQLKETQLHLENLNKKITKIENFIADIPIKCKREQAAMSSDDKDIFSKMIQQKIDEVTELVGRRKAEVEDTIMKMTEGDSSSQITKSNLNDLEGVLCKLYPKDFVSNYSCLKPVSLTTEKQALNIYTDLSNGIDNIHDSNFSGKIFNGLMGLLDKSADYPKLGLKLTGIMTLFLITTVILMPFAFISVMSLCGVIAIAQGKYIKGYLSKISSLKTYLDDSYNESKFEQDKSDVMETVCEFLNEAEEEAIDLIKSEKYIPDTDKVKDIQNRYDMELAELQLELKNYQQESSSLERSIVDLTERIKVVEEQEKALAEKARDKYLHTISWKSEWLDKLFIDVTEDNKIKMIRYSQGNSLYYSEDVDRLKAFSRLIIYQNILHMHPDFASTIVLDYKYNGGDLTQFSSIPDRCFKLYYASDSIEGELVNTDNRIRSRTNNILATCQSIDEYNELMKSYGTVGEYFVIVHIFGLTSFSNALLNDIRNGPRVGYFFKFYMTVAEMKELKDSIPYDNIQELFEIQNDPIPKAVGTLKRLLF